jgi:excisionase family DNA binding protein
MMKANDSKSRPEKRLYTVKETALYMGRTPWAVRHLVWRGVLPSVRIGRRMQIDIRDLDSLIERSKVTEH